MLLAVCDGAYPEPVIKLSFSLVKPDITGRMIDGLVKQVSGIGHHSGIAMLSGLIKAFG
jgi:hypothetical protein